ncbi:tRNA (guanosine(46)-N7)-methyltransferase TrmB [Treponema sp. HNW]|uniref:tRNA (guanosine(46)-N7)-methyltransferase TrmB n=1 Tax=Treponema sp. HNW TaxID=3116654 RepID=UPI003D127978
MNAYGSIRSFVLRAGRMTEAQQRDYDNLSSKWCIPFSQSHINYSDIFGNTGNVIVEIGFGMGQATSLIAEQNPDTNYIGIEVHRPGVGRLLGEIAKKNLSNLFIIEYDAVEVLETMIPDNSVQGFHVFFPDPWPKKKHHKRRLIKRPFTDTLCAKLACGGFIHMATDWEPYARFAMEELNATAGLKNRYKGFAETNLQRPETKFELKGKKAGRDIFELVYEKTDEQAAENCRT